MDPPQHAFILRIVKSDEYMIWDTKLLRNPSNNGACTMKMHPLITTRRTTVAEILPAEMLMSTTLIWIPPRKLCWLTIWNCFRDLAPCRPPCFLGSKNTNARTIIFAFIVNEGNRQCAILHFCLVRNHPNTQCSAVLHQLCLTSINTQNPASLQFRDAPRGTPSIFTAYH